MPRIIGSPQNLLVFQDQLSGSALGLYYRMPTTEERQGFLNCCVRRAGKKITMHHAEARLKYGLKILTGVRDGDFMRMGDNGAVAMSSNPQSPDYCEGWKAEMEAGCADVVMALGGQVFDAQPTATTEDDEAAVEGE